MTKETYLLLGAVITAVVGFLAARYTSGVQLRIAQDRSNKDLLLQEQRMRDERQRSETALERAKLETLHKILSTISLENSQTMSFFQSSGFEVTNFRRRYLDNCDRLHEGLAIADLYYPDMSSSIKEIYGQTNIFWGSQEALIQADIKANKPAWDSHLQDVLTAGNLIQTQVEKLHLSIADRGRAIRQNLTRLE